MIKNIKDIYVGETGTGKSYQAFQKALKNKGITIIFDGVSKNILLSSKASMKNMIYKFELVDIKDLCDLKISKRKKYIIYNSLSSVEHNYYIDYVIEFLNKKHKMLNKKNTMLVFDDGVFEDINVFSGFENKSSSSAVAFKEMRLLSGLSLVLSKTAIIITILMDSYEYVKFISNSIDKIYSFGNTYNVKRFYKKELN
ncbi:hypothetical protein [Agathobacter rectalis]|uniref:hypothetical protein n=1 Tax=Agathobacter rectalis TaxID=39491 RepID=UPI0027D23141|nr:hypothetical protein [Agathobacter rectalis]MCB7108823.1 hypothetical protein [Agathobacter rectalis]MCG4812115.1 hypothetical protein [Agathobacter rectalis]